jgi:NUDIX domain
MDARELREKRRLDFEYERLRKREESREKRIEDRARRDQEKQERDELIVRDRVRRDKKLKEIKERQDEKGKKCSCKNCWKLWGGGKDEKDEFIREMIKELCERKNGGGCKKYKKKQKGGDMRNIHDRIEMCINKPCNTNIYGEEGCIPLTIGKMKDYNRIMNISNPIKRTNALHEYEKVYCNNQMQSGGHNGGGGVILNGNETGAGVVLIENYLNRKHSRQEDAVILFRDKFSGKYNDGGGKIDPGETVERAARRELKEESENLFRLSPNSLNLQLASRHQNYIAYFVRITAKGGIQSKYYSSNLSSLKNGKNVPHHWLETDKMTRVYVKDLINNNIITAKGDFKVNDANGNSIVIEGKTKAVLREGLNNNIITMTPTQTLNINPNCRDQEIPHISTVCYWT